MDFGYDHSITWTHRTPRMTERTASFEFEASLIGEDDLVDILNAAKRLYQYGRSCEGAIHAVRLLALAISQLKVARRKYEAWNLSAINVIKHLSLAEGSKWRECQRTQAIIVEAARFAGLPLQVINPFRKLQTKAKPLHDAGEMEALIEIAKLDARRYFNDFKAAQKDEASELVLEAKALAHRNGGLLPFETDGGPFAEDARKLRTRVSARISDLIEAPNRYLARHLYATMESLIPFVVLLLKELAGNVSPVCTLQRDCMKRKSDPIRGDRWIVEADKRRADRTLQYSFADEGEFSVPWLIRAVQEMTQPLLPSVAEEFRSYLFIGDSWCRTVQPMFVSKPHNVFNSYKKTRGLSTAISLSQLRPREIVDEYVRSKDPRKARARAQHQRWRETMRYVDHPAPSNIDAAMLADAQMRMLESRTPKPFQNDVTPEEMPLESHVCLDPRYPKHGLDSDGFCAHLLWPLNDRHFVLRHEPRPIALLMREEAALLDARRRLPIERFNKLYLARFKLVQRELLEVSPELLDAARLLLPTLPPGLVYD